MVLNRAALHADDIAKDFNALLKPQHVGIGAGVA